MGAHESKANINWGRHGKLRNEWQLSDVSKDLHRNDQHATSSRFEANAGWAKLLTVPSLLLKLTVQPPSQLVRRQQDPDGTL
jgi:hypothetical protein